MEIKGIWAQWDRERNFERGRRENDYDFPIKNSNCVHFGWHFPSENLKLSKSLMFASIRNFSPII
jgi:hypothetical protein